MAAGRLDLSIEQGATFRRQLLWRRPSPDGGVTPGDPRDLTDCTARMQLRTNAASPAIVTLTDNDGITLGGADGTISVVIRAARTWLLTSRRYKYDLLIYFPGGDVVRLVEGNAAVDPAITSDDE